MVDPITGLGLFKAVADTGKVIADIAKRVTDHKMKQELNSVYDSLMDLKERAAGLEDENRELKDKLRVASQPKSIPNIRCLGPKTVFLRPGLGGTGWYEDSDKGSMNVVGVKVCFKNHSSDDAFKSVAGVYDVRASLTFLDGAGHEIGTGISEACWIGDLREINFGVEDANCAVVLLMIEEEFGCPFLRRTHTDWGDATVTDTLTFEAMPNTVAIRLLEGNRLLLPPCYFDVAMSGGELVLKQRSA